MSPGLPRCRAPWFAMPLVLATAAAALVGLPACGDDLSTPPEEIVLTLGPYPVGFTTRSFRYTPATGVDSREISVRVWYPAAPATGAVPAVYAVAGIITVPSEAALADPAPSGEGPFPVVVYSHGSGGEGLLAYPTGEHMASHGWIVVAPNHAGNTASDAVTGTRTVFARTAVHRPLDIRATLDWLGSDAGVLTPLADLGRVFLYGHSFGGYTAFAVAGARLDTARLAEGCAARNDCAVLEEPGVAAAFAAGFADPRVDAIAPQAPALVSWFATGELTALTTPVFLMTGRMDQTVVDGDDAWPSLDGADDLWLDLPNGAHNTFITICDVIPEAILALFLSNADADGCGPTQTPTTLAVPILTAYLHAFAEVHVNRDARFAPVLDGPALRDFLVVTRR